MTEIILPDRFEVLAELVRSPEVVLLRARDRKLHREVLLKLPGSDLASAFRDRSTADVLMREARALARLNHPGVARVLDVLDLEPQGIPVQVLEPVVGEPLANRLARERRLEPGEVAQLGSALAQILEAVHRAGLVHRGLSTSCILLRSDDSPYLTGFHFSKSVNGLGSLCTGSFEDSIGIRADASGPDGAAVAGPEFPAPEQYAGRPASQRSDLFSLGWVLFLCLTGESPFPEGVPAGEPSDASALVPTTPRFLARALARCLQVDPMRRFASAQELVDALDVDMDPLEAPLDAAPARTSRRTLGGAIAALALVAVGGYALKSGGSGTDIEAGDGLRGIGGVRAGRVSAELSQDYDKSYALVIGIGDAYAANQTGFGALKNAETDAEAIAEALEASDNGWEVERLLGSAATRAGVVNALGELAARTTVNDRVLIYYAGHGHALEKSETTGWMIPADASEGDRGNWVRFSEFSSVFDEAQAKHIMLAMDCCYGGRLTALRSKGASFNRKLLQEPAHVILTAGSADQQVEDGEGRHSAFAQAFLDALDADRPITSSELFLIVSDAFAEKAQTPRLGYPAGSRAQGQFVFGL